MNLLDIEEAIVELIRRCSTSLSPDVASAVKRAYESEKEGSAAKSALSEIIKNIDIADKKSVPMCQDTGYPIFYVEYASSEEQQYSAPEIQKVIRSAVEIASAKYYLRQNCIDTVNAKSIATNVYDKMPIIKLLPKIEGDLVIHVLLKGGGSENVSKQYSLPDEGLKAGRDLNGAYKCAIDAVFRAEGKGCPPGVLGVCIGGDRETGYAEAKRQLLRNIDDINEVDELRSFEERVLKDANKLGYGAMGLGGKNTLLAVKAVSAARVPASFFVTVSYNCWALRRRSLRIVGGEIEIV